METSVGYKNVLRLGNIRSLREELNGGRWLVRGGRVTGGRVSEDVKIKRVGVLPVGKRGDKGVT